MSRASASPETIHTRFWGEIAEDDNPFTAALCRCAGYDIYGDLLGSVSWIEYLYLLFHGERADGPRAGLLNDLAVAIANPGPRDYSVQAAMSGGAGGSTLASCLIAALAVGAGGFGGAREVYEAMIFWERCGPDMAQWIEALDRWRHPATQPEHTTGIWPGPEHPPGFDPHGKSCPTPVRQTLSHLARVGIGQHLMWLQENRVFLEEVTGQPLALSGVTAAALTDLEFDPQQGEILYLLLRLPGAAAHALEQHWQGCHRFPFYRHGINVTNDPGPAARTGEPS